MATKVNVAVIIYDLVELVDMNGPVDVFLMANGLTNGKYNVYTVGATTNPVVSEGYVTRLTPTYNIDVCPEPDIVVIPGMMGLDGNPRTACKEETDWIARMGAKNKLIMSVCIGAFVLAKTGLLTGKKVTTHYMFLHALKKDFPLVEIVENVRFVQDGNIITTGGITSGIDGALHIIEQNDGLQVAQNAANTMVYTMNAPLPPGTILPLGNSEVI